LYICFSLPIVHPRIVFQPLLFQTWKKRWFVLRLAHIAYYKTSKEYQLLRLLDLSDVHSCSPCALKKHTHTFALISPQRTYYLQAASDAEVQDWVRAINDTREAFRATQTQTSIVLPRPPSMAIPIPIPTPPSSGPQAASSVSKGFTATGGSPSDRRSGHVLASSASDSDFDPATSPAIGATMSPPSGGGESKKSMQDPNKIVLSGYLMKCASKRRNWRKRWFTLTHDRLTIRGSHMDTKHHREISVSQILDALEVDLPLTARLPGSPSVPPPLPNPSITGASNVSGSSAGGGASSVDAADTDQHVFKIVTAKRTLLLCAPTEEEEIKWLSVIRALIARRSSTAAPASGNVTTGSPGLQTSVSANPSFKTTGVSPSQPQQYPTGIWGAAPPSEVLTGHALSSSSSSSLAGKSMWRRGSLSNSVSKPPQPGTTLVEEPEHLH